jgi:hypothetical protein
MRYAHADRRGFGAGGHPSFEVIRGERSSCLIPRSVRLAPCARLLSWARGGPGAAPRTAARPYGAAASIATSRSEGSRSAGTSDIEFGRF